MGMVSGRPVECFAQRYGPAGILRMGFSITTLTVTRIPRRPITDGSTTALTCTPIHVFNLSNQK